MSDKNLVNVQIPAEEVENIDELVRDGYYGNRSVAIRDIIRRGAAHLRLGFRSVKPKEEDKKTIEMVYMRISMPYQGEEGESIDYR